MILVNLIKHSTLRSLVPGDDTKCSVVVCVLSQPSAKSQGKICICNFVILFAFKAVQNLPLKNSSSVADRYLNGETNNRKLMKGCCPLIAIYFSSVTFVKSANQDTIFECIYNACCSPQMPCL